MPFPPKRKSHIRRNLDWIAEDSKNVFEILHFEFTRPSLGVKSLTDSVQYRTADFTVNASAHDTTGFVSLVVSGEMVNPDFTEAVWLTAVVEDLLALVLNRQFARNAVTLTTVSHYNKETEVASVVCTLTEDRD